MNKPCKSAETNMLQGGTPCSQPASQPASQMSFPRKIPPLSPGNIGALSVEEIHQVFYDLHVHQVEMEMQKVESIGSLAKGIAHDLNNILFPISGRSEMLLDDTPLYTPELNSIEQSINPHNGAVIWSSRSCLSDLPINPIG